MYGLGLAILGGIIIGISWPGTDPGDYLTEPHATGSVGGVVFGFIVAGIGQLGVLVGLIAHGVKLGTRAA